VARTKKGDQWAQAAQAVPGIPIEQNPRVLLLPVCLRADVFLFLPIGS
jgi:hypothetical protein